MVVNFDNGVYHGIGIVCGFSSTEIAVIGRGVILEVMTLCDKDGTLVMNLLDGFTHMSMNEIHISV